MGGGRADADGGDFTRAEFSGGQVSFTDAKFSADLVNSGGAVFSGDQVNSGGQVSFAGAEFSGGQVSFQDAGYWKHPPTFSWVDVPPIGVSLPAQASKLDSVGNLGRGGLADGSP